MMKTMNPPSKDAAAHARTTSFTRNSRSMPSLFAAASHRRTCASANSQPPQHHHGVGSVHDQSTISSSASFSSFQQQKRTRDSFSSQRSPQNQTWSMPQSAVAGGLSPSHPQQFPAPQHPQPANFEPHASGGKRSRPNNYRAPREVKASVTSVLGSLAGGSATQSNTSVQIRRNLSFSQLDQFLSGGTGAGAASGGSDQMDTEDHDSTLPSAQQRERAMSM